MHNTRVDYRLLAIQIAFHRKDELHLSHPRGFTLIELSIVLVIIGFIVGGVLVGQDLVNASAARSQITQIEKYQQAVNTFRGKYNGYLPGDISSAEATTFGFGTRAGTSGLGDGDGFLTTNAGPGSFVTYEPQMFWGDLGVARLIANKFNVSCGGQCGGLNVASNAAFSAYLPKAAIGDPNYVAVYSDNAYNYYAVIIPNFSAGSGDVNATEGLSVRQAYAIDSKIDDGQPQTGNVLAKYPAWVGIGWSSGTSSGYGGLGPPGTAATAASATTCYDNSNVSGGTQQYSITTNRGSGVNCALSFKFQ